MRNILITGGMGFIGTEIVKMLSTMEGNNITVLDLMTNQIHGDNWENSYLYTSAKDKCNFVRADIRDFEAIKKALIDQEYIIHLAAETGTGQSMYMINHYNEVNIMGTSNILQSLSTAKHKQKIKKIILSSSRSVYGEGKYNCKNCGIVYPSSRKKNDMQKGDFHLYCEHCGNRLQALPTTEDSKINPNSLYAFTKFTQEQMISTMCPAMEIDYTIFRFQNVYGVGQSLKNPYTGILSIFSTLMLENRPINIFEDGMESRDFVYVTDIADAVIKSLDMPKSNSKIINLGSGIGTSVIEIAQILKKIYNSNSEIHITGDFRVGDIAHNMADITKAREILGFSPTITLEEGLNKFCAWVLKQRAGNTRYEDSLREMEASGMFVRRCVLNNEHEKI